jgi:hypothetical protein
MTKNTPANTPANPGPPRAAAPSPKRRARRGSSRETAEQSLARRKKALGLDTPPGKSLDELRRQLTLKLALVANRWHNCAEPVCQRNRGCMAPQGFCPNIPDPPPEEVERRLEALKPWLQKQLKARLAAIQARKANAGDGDK